MSASEFIPRIALVPPGPTADSSGAENFRILVVDDNPAGSYALMRHLRNAGYEVREASTGAECLNQVRAGAVDLVLLDIGLPDISGIEVCRLLKADPKTASTPIIQISARFTTDGNRIEGIESGADAYLIAPYEARELLAYVKTLLRARCAEDKLRFTIELSPQMPWTAGPDGKVEDCSERLMRLVGLSRDEVLDNGWFNLPHPDDLPALQAAWAHSVQSGEPFDFDYRLRLADGTHRWMRSQAFPHRGRDGKVLRWFGFTEDIHQRIQAERERRESESRFRALFEESMDAVFLTIPDGQILAANRAACDMFGMTEQEVRQAGREGILNLDDPRYAPALHTRQRTGRIRGELTCKRKDGSVFPVEVQSVVLDSGQAFVVMRELTPGRLDPHASRTGNLIEKATTAGVELLRVLKPEESQGTDPALAGQSGEMSRRWFERQVRLLESIASATPDFVYLFDLEGRFQYANRRLLEVWGVELKDAIGKTCRDLGYEQWHHDMHMREIAQVIQTRRPIKGEVPFRAPNTGIFGVYEYIFTPVINPEGHVELVAGTTRDVTDRKQSAEALAAEKELLAGIIDHIPVLLCIWDPGLKSFRFNKHLTDVLGWTEADATTGDFMVKAYPDPEYRAEVIRYMRSLKGGWRDLKTTAKNGEAIDCSWANIRLADGRSIGIAIDIRERRRVEEALRQSEERLRSAVTGSNGTEWEIPYDEKKPNGFSDAPTVAPDIRRFIGFGEDEPLTIKEWRTRIHPADLAVISAGAQAHLDGKAAFYKAEYRIRHQDGDWRYLLSTGRLLRDAEGRPLRWVGVDWDVTDRKKAEAVLARDKEELERLVAQRTARLQELVNELDHFSYTITHDMRAPLRAIRGVAELLSEPGEGWSGTDRMKLVQRIIRAAERMDALITDALQYSKAVRQELPLAPVDLRRLLEGIIDIYPNLHSHNADISIAPDLPWVLGNEAALAQCFSSFLGNAVRFTKPGEKARISIFGERFPKKTAGSSPEQWIKVIVADNGIGISEVMKPRLFGMFTRGSDPRAGTGIGLALARKMVDRMGGMVGVESTEGSGSRFWVSLKIENRY